MNPKVKSKENNNKMKPTILKMIWHNTVNGL
jgi:hypothetical protein